MMMHGNYFGTNSCMNATDKARAQEVIECIRPSLTGMVTSVMVGFYDPTPLDRKSSLDLETNKYLQRYLTNKCLLSL